jgi:DNA-binding CsgD family transcriptional regulator
VSTPWADRAVVPVPFVGRERELSALAAARKATASGPRFVLVGGEAGVGKSRLLAEFRRSLPLRPNLVGAGECTDVAPVPFAPFIAMLKAFAPEISRRLSVAPPAVTHGEAAVRTLFEDVRRALDEWAAKRAMLLYLEDLHFADSGTLALLAYLARACRGSRLLVVATYRSEALGQSDEFVATIARLVRLPNVTAIDLPPLSQRDARALAAGAIRADSAEARLVDELVTRADGNAFFLEELIKHTVERSPDEAASLPLSVTAVIRARLAILPASDRTRLLHAAVFGRRFDVELMCKLADVDRDELLATLRRARDAGLIVEQPDDARRLRFRHALTREAIVGGVLVLERRPMHARILAVLEALPDAEREGYRMELAYHALESHDVGKAVHYAEAAGDHAFALHAYADATHQYERAVAVSAAPLPEATRRRLLRKLGDSLHMSRSAHGARRAYGEALELAAAAGDIDDAGALAVQLAVLNYVHGNTSGAISMATQAIEILSRGGSESLRDVAAARLALYHLFRLETGEALRVLGTIVRPEAPGVAPFYHQARMGALAIDGDDGWKEEALLYLAAAEPGDEAELVALHNAADCAVATGEMNLAEGWLRRALSIGSSGYLPFALSGLAYQRFLGGDLSEAKRLAASAIAAGGWAMSDATSTATAIWTGLALGDDAFADAAYSEELVEVTLASGQSQNIGNVVGASADLLAERGHLAEARRLLHGALRRIEHPYLCETFLFVAARCGAEHDLARIAEIAAHVRRPRANALCAATIAMVDALIDQRRGREEEARRQAGVAAALFNTIGWKPLEAEALEIAGRGVEAAELYRTMGHVRGLRRLAASEARAPLKGDPGPAALLSLREREIAVLVARGESNRAIAQSLGIAPKTVEQHLSTVFAKLRVSSRTQLAAALSGARPHSQDRAT